MRRHVPLIWMAIGLLSGTLSADHPWDANEGWPWVKHPGDLAIDTHERKIYWAERSTIYRANLDGSEKELFKDSLYGECHWSALPPCGNMTSFSMEIDSDLGILFISSGLNEGDVWLGHWGMMKTDKSYYLSQGEEAFQVLYHSAAVEVNGAFSVPGTGETKECGDEFGDCEPSDHRICSFVGDHYGCRWYFETEKDDWWTDFFLGIDFGVGFRENVSEMSQDEHLYVIADKDGNHWNAYSHWFSSERDAVVIHRDSWPCEWSWEWSDDYTQQRAFDRSENVMYEADDSGQISRRSCGDDGEVTTEEVDMGVPLSTVIDLAAHDGSVFWSSHEGELLRWNRGETVKIVGTPVPTEVSDLPILASTDLHPNYPNPFNSGTRIPYGVSEDGQVSLTIHNALGQPVARLVDELHQAGTYEAVWDVDGRSLASGVYLARLVMGDQIKVRRLALLR